MRWITPICVAMLGAASAGCTRSAPAINDASTARPDATLQQPVSTVTPPATLLGEDEHGGPVSVATVDSIKSSLRDADPAARRAAIKRLAGVRWKLPDSVANVLTWALADPDPDVRIEAVRLAAADPQTTAEVAKLLHDSDERVRLTAAQTLVALGKHDSDAYPVLLAVLRDRKAAARLTVLTQIRDKAPTSRPALPTLIAMAQDAGDPLRVEAIDVLGRLGAGQEPVDALLLIAHDGEPKARAAALRSLARIEPASAKVQVAILKGLRDPNPAIRLAAAEGAGPSAVPTLIEFLRQGDEGLRDAAARSLGRIGPDAWAAGADLQRLAQSDPAERVRVSARTAFNAIVP